MIRRIALTIAAVALAATTAWAQDSVTGTVAYVDAATRTIHLTDGRSLRVGPGALVTVDGRQFPIEALQPGANVTLAPPAQTPSAAVIPAPGHPPVDVSGTVARIDRQNNVITLQDGRMVQMTGQSDVWQPSRIDTLQPGAQVFVRNAQPVISSTSQPTSYPRMGTVLRADPASGLIVLDDGSLVRVAPATRLHMAGRNLSLSELRPGDEIVIRPQQRVPAASGVAVSALPRDVASGTATIDATDIQIMRRVQSP